MVVSAEGAWDAQLSGLGVAEAGETTDLVGVLDGGMPESAGEGMAVFAEVVDDGVGGGWLRGTVAGTGGGW